MEFPPHRERGNKEFDREHLSQRRVYASDDLFARRNAGNVKMTINSVDDEILAIKRSLAAVFDNDLDRIVADIQSRQKNGVRLPPRPYHSEKRDCLPIPESRLLDGESSSAGS